MISRCTVWFLPCANTIYSVRDILFTMIPGILPPIKTSVPDFKWSPLNRSLIVVSQNESLWYAFDNAIHKNNVIITTHVFIKAMFVNEHV